MPRLISFLFEIHRVEVFAAVDGFQRHLSVLVGSVTLSIMTFSIMTLSIMTFSIMRFSINSLSMITLIIMS